jgi:hypothetical protein
MSQPVHIYINCPVLQQVKVEKDKDEVKRVSKTKSEADADLSAERGQRDAQARRMKKAAAKEVHEEEKRSQKIAFKQHAEENAR